MMIAEEESLRKRLLISIETCREEMSKLSLELQLPLFQASIYMDAKCRR